MDESRYFNDQGKVLCQVCMKPFQVISATHLKKHEMTIETYKNTYPEAPVSSKMFMAKNKYRDSTLFEDQEEKFGEDVKNVPDSNQVRKLVKQAETKTVQPEPACDLPPILKNKVDIKAFLKKAYSRITENYFIEKQSLSGHLEYSFITDIVDLASKTIFDFPKTFWHNRDARQDGLRSQKLESDGWTIITIEEQYPTVKTLQKYIDLVLE